jgi:tRNA-splicing ligase RtcB
VSGPVIFGDPDERTVAQLERCVRAEEGARGVLCADAHVGYSQPIGGAIAYREHVSPSGVGYDIGCGNKAVLTGLTREDVDADLPAIADAIERRVSFGIGRHNQEPADHEVLDRIGAASFAPQRELLDLAAAQLGTVGSGNHYVDLFADELDRVWVGVHFGSRGFGHRTASGFLSLARGGRFEERAKDGDMDSPPVLLAVGSELGQAYLEAMELAGEYAYAGRDLVVDRLLALLGTEALDAVHNHHNFAWRERGFVGATMGGTSVILRGERGERSADALHSTIHGAGRVMSRTRAAGKWRKRWLCEEPGCERLLESPECPDHPHASTRRTRVRVGGAIDFDRVRARLARDGVVLRGGGADEAPAAYRELDEVLAAHGDTIAVEHRLRPLVVVMAREDTYDPYKD